MKAALIADVHGNSPALAAVLEDIERYQVDELVMLGDLIEGIDPHGCVELLRSWSGEHQVKLTCVKGNVESYLLTKDMDQLSEYGTKYGIHWHPVLMDRLQWHLKRLSAEELAWINSWPLEMRWRDAYLVHDSPLDRIRVNTQANPLIKPEHREWFFHGRGITAGMEEEEWRKLFAFMEENGVEYLFCGHVHEVDIREHEGKIICSVGSAGTPLDDDWRVAWVLLDTSFSGADSLSVHRLPYDLERTFQLFDQHPDFPHFQEEIGAQDGFKTWYATGIFWKVHVPGTLPPRVPVIPEFSRAREDMVERDLVGRGITDITVLDAMRSVPREWFVDSLDEDFAYIDGPLPIGEGQTISQSYIVALMAELLELTAESKVLEIGTGSGYAAAVLSLIARQVFTVERHATLAAQAINRFLTYGFDEVYGRVGDGTQGWEAFAPYDAILVSAGAPHIPEALKQQLKMGGKLVIPVGRSQTNQWLLQVTKVGEDDFDEKRICPVRFVPLVGADGWQDDPQRA